MGSEKWSLKNCSKFYPTLQVSKSSVGELFWLQREVFLWGRQIRLHARARGQSHLRVIRRGRAQLVTWADLATEEASGQSRPPGATGRDHAPSHHVAALEN